MKIVKFKLLKFGDIILNIFVGFAYQAELHFAEFRSQNVFCTRYF